MKNSIRNPMRLSKRGTTLVELIVSLSLTAIFAVVCVALINPIERIYKQTERISRAQLLADTIVDSIRKECDDARNDDIYSVWIADGDINNDSGLFDENCTLKKDEGHILVFKKNNSYCEAIFSELKITEQNKTDANNNELEGTLSGHAVDELFKGNKENTEKGIVHFGYYQAGISDKGVYPLKSYDYTNPVLASTYGDFYVKIYFKNLVTRDETIDSETRKIPSFVECEVRIYEGDYIESDAEASKNLIYTRTAALCFSANGSAKGSGYQNPVNNKDKKDVTVFVIWDDNNNFRNQRPDKVNIVLSYGSKTAIHEISTDKNPNSFKYVNIDASSYSIALKTLDGKDSVEGYETPRIVWNSDKTEVVITIKQNSVKLVSGPTFKGMLNSSLIGVVFCSHDEALANGWIESSDTYKLASIPSDATNDNNRTEDYKLYIKGNMAYVTSSDGSFVANEDSSKMFMDCSQLRTITDLNRIDTSNVIDMHRMFMNCKKLTELHVENWNTANVETFDSMFRNICCDVEDDVKMTVDLSSFDFSSAHYYYDGNGNQNNQVDGINKLFCKDSGTSHIDTIIFPAGHKDMSKLTRLQGVFKGCDHLVNLVNFNDIDFSGLRENHDPNLPNYRHYDNAFFEVFTSCTSLKEVDLSNWKCPGVTNVKNMLNGASNLEKLNMSGLNISGCSSLDDMFKGVNSIKEIDFHGSNFSGVESLEGYFNNKTSLQKINLNNCNTSSLTSVARMFNGCTNLNTIEMNNFVGSSCTTIESLFENCKNVQTLEIDGWNTSNVLNMAKAFKSCHTTTTDGFVVSLDDFDFDKVTDMSYMFNGSGVSVISFQNSNSTIVFPNVDNIVGLFQNCKGLTKLQGFNVSFPKVKDASSMFGGCSNLEKADFNMHFAIVENINNMFSNCTSLSSVNLTLDLPKVTSATGLFTGCTGLNTAKLNLDFPVVASVDGLFQGCTSVKTINLTIDADTATSAKYLFSGCTNLTTVTLDADLPAVKDISYMFSNCTNLVTANVDLDFQNANNAEYLFNGCKSLKNLSFNLNLPNVTDMNYMFKDCISLENVEKDLNFPNAENALGLFYGCTGLKTIKSKMTMPNIESLYYTFKGCTSLESVDLSYSSFDYVDSINSMFEGCTLLNKVTMEHVNLMSVTRYNNVFKDCSSLKIIDMSYINLSNASKDNLAFIKNVGTLNELYMDHAILSGVTSFYQWFYNKQNIIKVDFSGADLSACTSLQEMFRECSNLDTVDFSDVTLDNCTTTTGMFLSCYKLYTINMKNFVTPINANCKNMFKNCYSARVCDFSGWDTSSVTTMEAMFFNFCYCDNNNCKSKEKATIDISSFDFGKVQTLYQFFQCDKPENGKEDCIERVKFPSASNGGDPVAAKVQNMSYMFRFRKHLLYIDNLGELTATAATINNLQYMFSNAGVYELDISGINLDGYKYTGKNWFDTCENLTTIYVAPGTDWSQVQFSDTTNMFNGSTKLVGKDITGTYPDFAYTSTSVRKEYARINGLDGKNGYFTAKSA